ncbi:hypothetical protein [Halorientalis litorea]|jgi:hypothetical protein|uniref:hypothetical protein n=1 Tax=Halorientalis litorea TaxID=2931977 RepID=UPI001FF26A0E|nr:hypothetical protein [Halorientalis litorea]
MSTLTATIHVGSEPPLGGGLEPAVVAHLYEGAVPRILAYEVATGADGPPTLDAVQGAYAPEIEAAQSYPVTDLLLALHRDGSSIAQRLDTLSEKARANYGRTFREMVFASDVAWGSDGYGRLFEARSQLEAHPFESVVAVGFHDGASDAVRNAIADNLDRIDGPTRFLSGGGTPPR